ncbi:hypothetical protein [Thalassobacillus sp. C254]|uniref:hypothetical protein n=1 Tax=Thalassobacillus sp. C254 TaxID=1225341 RepID=UPI0006D0D0C4|nr:hypothetical protein [Thalassobacillus sp. C254]
MARSVYYYAVMFITLMMMIGGTVAAFMNGADLVVPQGYYLTYEEFKDEQAYKLEEGTVTERRSEEALAADYDRQVKEFTIIEKQRAMNDLIKNIGWIIIPFPIFSLCE